MGSIRKDTWIPSDKELTVEEIPISSPHLRCASHFMGKACDEESKEFMLCRHELLDPRKCIKEGKVVTACGMKFLRNMKAACYQEFEAYAHCVDFSSTTLQFKHCRKSQAAFDKCMLDNMGMERPPTGYFARPRVHRTKRPQPPLRTPKDYPDRPAKLPDDYPRPDAKYGTRFYGLE